MTNLENYYETLGLKPNASMEEIKEAYRDLVNVWHPDRFSHNPRLQKKAQEKLKDINQAYERLESHLLRDSAQGAEREQDEWGKYLPIKKGSKYGYVDKNGKIVINPEFDLATEFSEGLAAVMIFITDTNSKLGYTNKLGYIDKTGKMVIKPQFDLAADFSEGLAAIMIGGKFGYIDKTGKIVIRPQFDLAFRFTKESAMVNIGDRWFHINKTYQDEPLGR